VYHANHTTGDETPTRRRRPAVRLRAGTVLVVGALAVVAAGCGSSSDGASFTPAAPGSRPLPSVAAPNLPPIGQFIRQSDGAEVSTVSSDYLFDVGSDKLVPEATQALAAIVPQIREHPGPVQVIGFTDGVGSAAFNQGLSERRAGAVKAVLVQDGIPDSSLQTLGKGSDGAQPNVPDSTRRKVEIVLK
jgi:OOP family OmpA-OmpF porin